MQWEKGFWLILAIFILLGIIYSVVTPVFEVPDEIWHFAYVRHVATERGLPVQDPESPGPWRQEGSQPPLYYILGALLTSWIDMGDFPRLARLNPHATGGHPEVAGNRNIVLHGPWEAFPWHGSVLAVHLLRLFSLGLAAITVWATYRLAEELFPAHKALALGAAALVAFNPQFLFIGAAVNNDNLVIALSSLSLLLLLRLFLDLVPPTPWRLAGLGVLLGAAALSKLSGLALLPLTVLVLAILAWRRRSWRFLLGAGALTFGTAGVVAGWWYVRNLALYGDPTGLNAMLAVAQRRPIPVTWGELQGLELSYWAVFGWFNVLAERPVYVFFQALDRLSLVGLAAFLWRHRRDTRMLAALALPVLWLALVLASLLRWISLTMGAQGRLLFPAAPSVGLLLALGLTNLVPKRWEKAPLGVATLVVLLIALICPFRYITPAYAPPPTLDYLPEEAIPNPVHIVYGGKVELMGYELRERKAWPGQALHITLYWRALVPMEENYSVYIHLRTPEGALLGQRDSYPGLGNYPTSLWRPGEVVKDTYDVLIKPDAPAPVVARIEVGLYTFADKALLPARDPQGRDIVPVIGRFKVRGEPQAFEVANPLSYSLGDEVTLMGYELAPKEVEAGGTIRLALYWQARREMGKDYVVFVHLVDEEGNLWSQADGEPCQGKCPTSFWDEGETIRDERDVPVPSEAPPGRYRLVIGMYEPGTGQRLPLRDERGTRLPGDGASLEGITVR